MKSKIVILLLVLALLLIAAGAVLANGVELPRWVLGGGASDSAAGDVTLRATLGQPLVGIVSGGDVTLGQGFWHGGDIPEGKYEVYLPLVQK